jgi:hypothetical protein
VKLGFQRMKAMARHRSHSIEFKRQVAQEFIAGESLYALSKRHDISRQLIRVWVQKWELARTLSNRCSGYFSSRRRGLPTRTWEDPVPAEIFFAISSCRLARSAAIC